MLYNFDNIFKLNIGKKYFKWFRLLRLVLLGLIISIIAKPLIATAYIGLVTNGERYLKPEKVPQERVAIVFGASFHCATLDIRRKAELQSYF
jgi:vancomycin permeability regulator SanA